MGHLMNWAKIVAYWTLPLGFQELGKKALEQMMRGRLGGFPENAKFRDIHKGQRCFILATGPSINEQNLIPLKNEICISVSMFFLHQDYSAINPLYHVFAPNHPPYTNDIPIKYIGGLNKVRSAETAVFYGDAQYEYSFRNFLNQNPEYKRDNDYYINYNGSDPIDESNYNNPDIWDISKTPFSIRSVTYSAIQMAAYMGFKKIYLLGVDYDYLSGAKIARSAHFYEAPKGIDDSALNKTKENFFYGYYMTWVQFRLIREYLKETGCEIFNASAHSYLDVFDMADFEKTLAEMQ